MTRRGTVLRLSGHSFIKASAWNQRVLEHRWGRAMPFPHVVMREAVDEQDCQRLSAALDEEDASRLAGEIYEVNATGEEFKHATLRSLVDELNEPATLESVGAVTQKKLCRAKVRGYAYVAGDYLLPHADRDADALRQVAFVLYVVVTPDLCGGELELFHCDSRAGTIIETHPAGRIAPRVGTLALFDVSDVSLHQVREVTCGTRGSLAGWFY